MADYNVLIIGAGVVGLALAEKISKNGKSVLLIERHSSFGNEISSRNSEVIHSGIYYDKNSLKATLCLKGNVALYDWCQKFNVPHSRTGKYIIATNNDELSGLDRLLRKGNDNNVEGLRIVEAEEVIRKNFGINCVGALYSPNSGIVDSHKLMESFIEKSKEQDCDFAYNHKVLRTEYSGGEYNTYLQVPSGESFTVTSDFFINSAGLDADLIAESAGIDIDKFGYRINYVKGHYFKLRAGLSGIATNLIYPVPPVNFTGLGVHITLDLSGGLKLGPDVYYMDERVQDYTVPNEYLSKFYDSAKRFIPKLMPEDLSPDQSGIRPKLQKPGEPTRDFIISEESEKGLPRMINLIGIESPGLTSCLSIAEYVNKEFLC